MTTGLEIFGVACNVMQTIQFATQVIAVYRRIQDGKSPAPEIDVRLQELNGLAVSLQKSLDHVPTTTLLEEDREMKRVAKDLIKTADYLQKDLARYMKNSVESRGRSILKTTKFIFRRSKIDELDQKLQECQKVMETRILLKLSKRTDSVHTTLDIGLVTIDHQLNDFICLLRDGNTQLRTLVDESTAKIRSYSQQEAVETRAVIGDIVASESTNTRRHVTTELDIHCSTQATQAQINAFLSSLKYSTMYARENMSAIHNSDRGTFEWIFKTRVEAEAVQPEIPKPRWDSFSDWLQSDGKLYWISGKPGSGKSSLIRFLSDEPRTRALLQNWIPHYEVTILRVFIWSAGDENQRSQRGMLATLLHQLLLEDRTLVPVIGCLRYNKGSINDWSLDTLLRLLLAALDANTKPTCIFIDGLDEIDSQDFDGWRGALKVIQRLENLPRVKLCLGSRSEQVFATAFANYPQLRVHDLTRDDMIKHVRERLSETQDCYINNEQLLELAERIVTQSEGIFLWVALVTKSVCRDLPFEDWHSLLKRIDQLPSDLARLYKEMWDRVNKDDKELYRRDAALYFMIVLKLESVMLFQMLACAMPEVRQEVLGGWCDIDSDNFIQQCIRFIRKILVRSAGLLEVSFTYFDGTDSIKNPAKATVTFIHRSARDFLTDSAEGQNILQNADLHPVEIKIWYLFTNLHLCSAVSLRVLFLNAGHNLFGLYKCICELPGLEDLLFSFIDATLLRFAVWRRVHKSFPCVKLAASLGHFTYVERQLKSLPPPSANESLRLKRELLARAVGAHDFQTTVLRDEKDRNAPLAQLVSSLLDSGVDANTLLSEDEPTLLYRPGHRTVFVLCLLKIHAASFDEPVRAAFAVQWLQILYKFLDYGADTKTSILVEFVPFVVTSSTRFGSIHPRLTMECQNYLLDGLSLGVSILAVISAWDLVCYIHTRLVTHILSDPENPDFLPRPFETRSSIPISSVLIIRKSSDAICAIQRTSDTCHICDVLSDMQDLTVAKLQKLRDDIETEFERDVMNGSQTLNWLVSNNFVPVKEAASSLETVVFESYPKLDEHDISTPQNIDRTYKPEYDRLSAAVTELCRGLRN